MIASRREYSRPQAKEHPQSPVAGGHMPPGLTPVRDARIEQLEAEVVHRQLLLEEVIQWTKNTLHLAVEVLDDKIDDARDDWARRTVRGVQDYLLTVCHAHDRFYGAPGNTRSSLSFRIYGICSSICQSFGQRIGDITLSLNIAEIPLARHREISMNLILQELVVNALKHAFTGRKQGAITIELILDQDSMCHLIVSDDGIGPSSAYGGSSRSWSVIEALAAGLQGHVVVMSAQGTTTTVSFPLRECAPSAGGE